MKTRIINLFICFALATTLSGCFEMDFSGADGLMGGFGGGYYSYEDYPYEPSFFVDSVSHLNDSTIKIWANIRYDSILTLENRIVSYFDKNGTEVKDSLQSQPEIIDFTKLTDIAYHWTGREEKIYQYSINVTNLEKNFDYWICIHHIYSYKEISSTNIQCFTFRLN